MRRTLLSMLIALPTWAHADALETFCQSEYADAKRREACVEFHRNAHALFEELLANRERMEHAMEELRNTLAEELRRAEEALRKYREELERLQGERKPHHSTESVGAYMRTGNGIDDPSLPHNAIDPSTEPSQGVRLGTGPPRTFGLRATHANRDLL